MQKPSALSGCITSALVACSCIPQGTCNVTSLGVGYWDANEVWVFITPAQCAWQAADLKRLGVAEALSGGLQLH